MPAGLAGHSLGLQSTGEIMNMQPALSTPHCLVCNASTVRIVPGFETLHRVTSDCKSWPDGGHLCVCDACGCIQSLINANWHAEAEQIYKQYTIYHQSDGAEHAG